MFNTFVLNSIKYAFMLLADLLVALSQCYDRGENVIFEAITVYWDLCACMSLRQRRTYRRTNPSRLWSQLTYTHLYDYVLKFFTRPSALKTFYVSSLFSHFKFQYLDSYTCVSFYLLLPSIVSGFMLLYCPFALSRHIAPSILWFFLKWLFRVYFCIENINNSFFVFFKNIFCCPPKWMPTIFWPTKTVFSKMLSSHISRHFSIYKKHFSKTFFHVLILTKNFFIQNTSILPITLNSGRQTDHQFRRYPF